MSINKEEILEKIKNMTIEQMAEERKALEKVQYDSDTAYNTDPESHRLRGLCKAELDRLHLEEK